MMAAGNVTSEWVSSKTDADFALILTAAIRMGVMLIMGIHEANCHIMLHLC